MFAATSAPSITISKYISDVDELLAVCRTKEYREIPKLFGILITSTPLEVVYLL